MSTQITVKDFRAELRHWRHQRKLSQLDLALSANVSQRHVSWLETGRSRPSREMIVRLSQAMDIPLRQRNVLLQAAGFAAIYRETELDQPIMEPVLNALKHVLTHHNPFPAFVIDRLWNIKMSNQAADNLLERLGDIDAMWQAVGDNGQRNLALLTLHPQGLRPMINNWDTALPAFIRRLKHEAISAGSGETKDYIEYMIGLAGEPEQRQIEMDLLPILPLEISLDSHQLNVFSVISTFGTPQDLTTDELRVEAFYPADTGTELLLRQRI